MQIFSSIETLRVPVAAWKASGQHVAFVPTMGNLHAGHLALVEQARARADRVVVSIFVNPMQFNEAADFDAYPRTLEEDRHKLQAAGIDALFVPDDGELYPRGQDHTARVQVPGLADVLEGAFRPGHFTGVATVVAKLFNIVQPDTALFGEKDFQQLLLVRRMVRDLDMPIEIVQVATSREPDGLAMSSRNRRLSSEQRAKAPALYATLRQLEQRMQGGESDFSRLESGAMQQLAKSGFQPEYVAIRRAEDLLEPQAGDRQLVILAAAWLGDTRLIDNIPLALNLNP